MKQLFLIFSLALSVFNCKEKTLNNKEHADSAYINEVFVVTPKEVSKKDLILNQIEGKWYRNDKPYNGYSIKCYPNGNIKERWGFYKGKREGVARRWSENGVLRVESYYHQNRLVGTYKTWWDNAVLAEESYYVDGTKEGDEKQWYPNGQLSKLRRLVHGKEEGLQQAWLQNGKTYVNYEAKNGRIFGMKRANSCYKLENEVVVRSE
ncbi:toxin-antitoxin system YwqK family antitoxin [Eudoraea sp.]|uniref:toxin-antitoxin system YwqK family antitoxin n=1 Tax=Eudoraea sp. TaxID=1979955 RepID=UPI003C772610